MVSFYPCKQELCEYRKKIVIYTNRKVNFVTPEFAICISCDQFEKKGHFTWKSERSLKKTKGYDQ